MNEIDIHTCIYTCIRVSFVNMYVHKIYLMKNQTKFVFVGLSEIYDYLW